MSATFKVLHAGPFVSVQDIGRQGYQRFGVSQSGPMDRVSPRLLNFALGRNLGAPVIEVSLGGLDIECTAGAVVTGVAGGNFKVTLDDRRMSSFSTFVMEAGMTLRIRPGTWGNWSYVGFAGEIDAPDWLGSQSVHLATGVCGRPFQKNDTIDILNPRTEDDQTGTFLTPDTMKPLSKIRAVRGPQDRFFDITSLDGLFSENFTITSDYNRMGVRLSGPKMAIGATLDMPSEPIARGTLQVPGHGDPILLMADHQTTGGYPKIATVISCDQDALAQFRPGDQIYFTECDADHAVKAARTANEQLRERLEKIAAGKISLEERLAKSNLISGLVDAQDPSVH